VGFSLSERNWIKGPMTKNEQPVRIAIIGAGSMANHVHYPALASFEDVEIAAICDLDPTRLQATANKYEIEGRYSDYRQMIEAVTPDAVYAIGQPHIMYDIWVWCLQQGLNLYIEKPMGITLHQARTLAWLAEQRGCITQVSFQRRVSPLAVYLRTECLKRGPIVHAECAFFKHEPNPYLQARDHMMDDGVHAIDTVRWMCGGNGESQVVEVKSCGKRVGTPDLNFFSALLQFDNGATGVVLCNWASGRRIFKVEMHAPGICAEAELETRGRLYANGDTHGVEFDARTVAGGDELYIFGGFQAKNREFIDAIKTGVQPGSNFADAIKTMEVAETILAQTLLKR
jgi:virulence factor